MKASGYKILPSKGRFGYFGVDREPFEPKIVLEDILDATPQATAGDAIWKLYPDGWRRDAYRLFESDTVDVGDSGILLLKSKTIAKKIAGLIGVHLGSHEVLHCEVSSVEHVVAGRGVSMTATRGFDLAYPSGDCYSAILNGLLWEGAPAANSLKQKYLSRLNACGLFDTPDPIPEYLGDFRSLVPSEAESCFAVYAISD